MQTIRNTRNCPEAQLASGTPAAAGVAALPGSGAIGFTRGVNLASKAMGLSGMQCSGGRTCLPGDDL